MKTTICFRSAVEALTMNPRRPLAALSTELQNQQTELRSRYLDGPSGLIIPYKLPASERRDMSVTGGTTDQYGGDLVASDVPEAGVALMPQLHLARLGARFLNGLKANIGLPYGSTRLSAEWLSENEAGTDLTEALGVLSMTPKRVSAYVPVSSQLVTQGGPLFDLWLRNELLGTLAVEIERVAIAGTGTNGVPPGILATQGIGSVVGGTNGAAPDYTDLTDLEYAVTATQEGGNGPLGWLVSPKVRKKLRHTFINGTGSLPLWLPDSADRLLGHPAGVTTAVPDNLTKGSATGVCSALIFGNFAELFVGLWGSGIVLDATVDRNLAIAGQVLISAHAYVDCGVRNPNAFAAMQDALAA